MKTRVIILLALLLVTKVVVKIESCSQSGRCRVYFQDGSTDLLFNPFVGQKIVKGKK